MVLFVVLLFLLFFYNYKTSLSKSFIISLLQFSFGIIIFTESLSLINYINLQGIFALWIMIVFCSLFYLFYKRKEKIRKFKNFIYSFKLSYKNFNSIEKTILFFIFLIVLFIFIQGVLYPPNNWDSLTYHLSRIMYWISNNNLNHFQTHILRNLYQPPFSEYVILHLNVLSGNDSFSNCIQWIYLLGSSAIVWQILSTFKISNTIKLLSILYLITIPSVILQASTTKNDIICGFFILSSLLYLIKIYNTPKLRYFIYLGISIGAGVLTKGTFYVFAFPIIILFAFLYIKLGFIKNLKNISYLFLAIILAGIINLGHFSRNYQINKNIISIDQFETQSISNSEFNLNLLTSNVLKNIGLHINYPFIEEYHYLNEYFHKKINININNNQLNYLGIKYLPPNSKSTHEDDVSNFLHLFLIFGLFLILFIRNKKYKNLFFIKYISLIVIFQFILFCLIIKWQPWHTRLHIPIFMLSSLVVFIWLDYLKQKLLFVIIFLITMICNSCFFINYNNLRPFTKNYNFTKPISINDNTYKKYFSNQLHLHQEYQNILFQISKNEKIGLIMSDWEYPLFVYNYYEPIKIVSIQTNNVTSKITQNEKNITGIISNIINKEFIIHENQKYINKTKNNKFLWIYRLN